MVFLLGTSCSGSSSASKAVVGTPGTSTSGVPTDTSSEDTSGDPGTSSSEDTGSETGHPTIDEDSDGFPVEEDCDDADPSRYPGASEDCSDGVVNDCDGDTWSARVECGSIIGRSDALSTWSLSTNALDTIRVRSVGDVDGDGFDDVAVGAPGDSLAELAVGSVRVFHGPHSGTHLRGDEDVLIVGEEQGDAIGWDIAPMGDLDGDGYDDYAVGGSDSHHGSPTGTPSVYVVHGPGVLSRIGEALMLVEAASQLECLGSVLESVPDADGDGVADLLVGGRCESVVRLLSGDTPAQVPGADDITTFVGPDEQGRFGHAFATGDLNSDGQGDVAIGDPDAHGTVTGRVSVFSGPHSTTAHYEDASASIQAREEDSANGFVLLGSGVATGDLNDDGYDDLAAGAPLWSESSEWGAAEGLLVVYFGPLNGTYTIGDADFRMKGEEDHSTLGGEMWSGQDLDGDGADDLLVGNGYNEINGSGFTRYSRGSAAYVLRAPLSPGTWTGMDADFLLADTPTTDFFGQHATIAGDANGDGVGEVIVGDWYGSIHLFAIPGD